MTASGALKPAQSSSPEAEWLLDSARAFVRPETTGVELDAGPNDRFDASRMDWVHLIQLAEHHGMTSLLHRRIEASRCEVVPSETRAALRARYIERVGRNLHLSSQLLDLLDALRERGIRAVPYKGPAMTAALYGSVALRDFRDLDIFIDKSDVLKAKTLLIERGFQADVRLTETSESALLTHGCEYSFRHTNGVQVEIHWALLHRYLEFPVEDGCWKRLRTTELCGHEVPSFSPEDQLLALCAHGAKHCWERLVWVCDVARLVQAHVDLDWDEVFRRAASFRGRRVVALGLWLVHDYLGVVLPSSVLRRIRRDRALPSLARRVLAGMFGPAKCSWTPARKSAFHLRCRDGLEGRIRYVLLRLANLNTNDWTSASLPAALQFLHYPLRVVRLLASRLRRPVRA